MSDVASIAAMVQMGRPRSVMTPEVEEAIIRAIEMGLPLHRAAYAAGVNKSTARAHRNRNEQFATRVKMAEAQAELGCVTRIQAAAVGRAARVWVETDDDGKEITVKEPARDPIWQCDAWMLERRFPQRWAKRETIRATVERKPEPDPAFD